MAQSCPEGKYLDSLVRKCVSCSEVCHGPVILTRCSEYCVAWQCKSVSGQFYDRLLKKCLKCSDLCGSHPSACSEVCKSAQAGTQRPGGGAAVPRITTRGRHTVSRAQLYSEALLYSLLGLCIAVLMCTLTAALLVLLRRAKGHRQEEPNKHGQSSKDSLVARAEDVCQEGVTADRPTATETCVYCFCDHTRAPHGIPQQSPARAGDNRHHDNRHQDHRHHDHRHQDNRHHDNGPANHAAGAQFDKTRSFRIICSPTQTSM